MQSFPWLNKRLNLYINLSTAHSKLYQVPGTKYEVWILNLFTQCHGSQWWSVGF